LSDTYTVFVNNDNESYIVGDRGTFLKYSQSFPPSQAGYIVGDEIVCQNEISLYKTAVHSYSISRPSDTEHLYSV